MILAFQLHPKAFPNYKYPPDVAYPTLRILSQCAALEKELCVKRSLVEPSVEVSHRGGNLA